MAIVEEILSLPPYLVHEESRASFSERLKAGALWVKDRASCLMIPGDGVFGKRLFILDECGSLLLVEGAEDEQGRPFYTVFRNNRAEKALSEVCSFSAGLFKWK